MAGRDLSVYVNIGGRLHSSLASSIATAKGSLSSLTRHFVAQAAAQKAAIRGMMDSFKGMAAFAAAGGLAFSVKKAFGAGADYEHEVQKLRSAGRSVAEIAEGIAEANKTIRDLPTGTLTGSIKLLNETTGAFGDYKHAVENLNFNSKLASVLQLGSGSEDPEHDIGSLIKALEIRGSASNPEKYRREAGELQRAMTFFGGRLKADQIYDFASNAQTGIRQLSERSLTKIFPSLIQELGGAKTGTGLTAFRRIISGQKISDIEQANAWVKLGLLNKKEIKHNKAGQITGWQDGAIKGTNLAYRDPLAFMEKVILPRLQKQGVNTSDPLKLGKALNTLFKNTRANAFVTAISTVVDRARLKKDEDLINKVLDLNKQYDSALANDPKLAMRALQAALTNLGTALTAPLQTPFAQALVRTARAVQALAATLNEHPRLAKIIGGVAVALTSMAAIRLASFIFGLTGLGRALAMLAIAAPLSLASRLVAISRAMIALSLAATAGLAGRLRAVALGVFMLSRAGGARAVLAAVGGALLGLGARVLTFPLLLLRGIGFALRGLLVSAAVGTGIGAILAAFVALGLWVSNNWSDLKSFFEAFSASFMKNLGPGTAGAVKSVVGALRSVWDWANKLLGPIDETGKKWASWGESAGKGAAAVVTALEGLPGKLWELGVSALAEIKNINWTEAGQAIVSGIVAGIAGGASAIGGAVRSAVVGAGTAIGGAASGAWSGIKSGASALKQRVFGPSLPGRYAGGPVAAGMPYIVGERGPEIFVPNTHGSIKTNAFLSGLGSGPTVDASAVARTRALAGETGMVLHRTLDATRKPIVDTSSIDEAAIKVASLGSALGGLGGSLGGGGSGGGAGGGGGGGGRVDGSIPAGNFAGLGHIASQAERAAYIKEAAKARGIDGNIALTVAKREGFGKYVGDYGTSFGDFQLHTGGRGPRGMRVGGLGDIAMRQGINIHDPKTWKRQVDFALDQAKKGGWGPWHGWRGSRWAGIRGARALGGPVGGGLPYLVGERGPEIFTPGESGRIASNREIARLTDPSAVARLAGRGGSGVSVSQTRGDSHYSPSFTIHGGGDVARIKSEVESHFWDMVRQAEREQAGSLSD